MRLGRLAHARGSSASFSQDCEGGESCNRKAMSLGPAVSGFSEMRVIHLLGFPFASVLVCIHPVGELSRIYSCRFCRSSIASFRRSSLTYPSLVKTSRPRRTLYPVNVGKLNANQCLLRKSFRAYLRRSPASLGKAIRRPSSGSLRATPKL